MMVATSPAHPNPGKSTPATVSGLTTPVGKRAVIERPMGNAHSDLHRGAANSHIHGSVRTAVDVIHRITIDKGWSSASLPKN
jgi:hypothetical protein